MEQQLKAKQILNFEIPATPAYIGVVRRAVVELAGNIGFSNNEIDELKLAVGEALTNAVQHCAPREDSPSVAVMLAITTDGLMVEISNQSQPYCIPSVPATPDVSKERGYGLFLMSHMVDQLDIVSGEKIATVRMLKKPKRVRTQRATQPALA